MLVLLISGFLFNGRSFGESMRPNPKKKRPMIERVHENTHSVNNSKKKVSNKKLRSQAKKKISKKKAKAVAKKKASAQKAKAKKKIRLNLNDESS